ncbi:MAG: PHP domain-containing protein [Clostridia bacterium]|nr:PHP domain-containing protein [Clostridia bacterium]
MKIYYDFHIHSCLSPCGDAEMTPHDIVQMAAILGLDAIALTDHNACGNCPAAAKVAREVGITLLPGMELCTAEEAHVVCLFPTVAAALAFEAQVYPTLPPIQNRPDIFGEQVIMNAADEPIGTQEILLTTASGISVDGVVALARSFGGTAFPAHIDRPSYSVTAALGDLPPVGFTAVEITAAGNTAALKAQYAEIGDKPLLLNSDAHRLDDIAEASAYLELPDNTAETIIAALNGELPCAWSRG